MFGTPVPTVITLSHHAQLLFLQTLALTRGSQDPLTAARYITCRRGCLLPFTKHIHQHQNYGPCTHISPLSQLNGLLGGARVLSSNLSPISMPGLWSQLGPEGVPFPSPLSRTFVKHSRRSNIIVFPKYWKLTPPGELQILSQVLRSWLNAEQTFTGG